MYLPNMIMKHDNMNMLSEHVQEIDMIELPKQTIAYLQYMLDAEECTCGDRFCYKCNAAYCLLEIHEMLDKVEREVGMLIASACVRSKN